MTDHPRRGRPRAGEQAARREAALDAALSLLVEVGSDGLTMQAVATRAGSSKESLYSWFGNRTGLLTELIHRQAAAVAAAVTAALETPGPFRPRLTAIAESLLHLLLSPPSLAINRAAIADPDLAALLLHHGRRTTGPFIETYLAANDVPNPPESFRLLYGLLVRDHQIRALLGEHPPPPPDLRRQAQAAVDHFLALVAPDH
ncbi:AcrR family transcriptional regulator [Actinokineospora baliensis]|uniref:TetR/AcrR family transcriptional regulator n=1 Tax=Actinokineospora baliensis TaxID=547056 RepID=UPI001956B8ED|nr:TetR/AcrR family transcriptional regulator [Actinokineospora baliensis]MBM7774790.1 AcrR family transcriptional regulator [Actinokineospora baliensis]